MTKLYIEDTTLTAMGDAVRGLTGETALMSPAQMIEAISKAPKQITSNYHYLLHNRVREPDYIVLDTSGCNTVEFDVLLQSNDGGTTPYSNWKTTILVSYGYALTENVSQTTGVIPTLTFNLVGDEDPQQDVEVFSATTACNFNQVYEDEVTIDVTNYSSVVLKISYSRPDSSYVPNGHVTIKNLKMY